MQSLLFNELDKRTGFYKMLHAESVIRNMAENFSNSYMITIFACCRQLYNPMKMKDCIAKSEFAIWNETPDILGQNTFIEQTEESTQDKINRLQSRSHGDTCKIETMNKLQNFLFMWGCRPSNKILAETTMVKDVVRTLLRNYDRNSLSIELPRAFEHLKGEDAKFEMVTSNTI